MDLTFFKGIITGLILSIPFGPVGIYCMEKILMKSPKKGYVSALGMITIDVVYGITALLFLSQVEDTIRKYELYLQILIGLFLMVVGWKKVTGTTELKAIDADSNGGLIKDYFTTFFIALANISSVFSIVVIFTALKVYVRGDYMVVVQAVSGIFIGGASEWLMTTCILTHFKKLLNEDKLIKLSKLCSFAIFVFGIIIMGAALVKLF